MKMIGIKQLRIKAGLTTDEVVNELGISRSMLYKVEQGHRSPSKGLIMRMSSIYHCSIEDIFLGINITNSDKTV